MRHLRTPVAGVLLASLNALPASAQPGPALPNDGAASETAAGTVTPRLDEAHPSPP